MSTSDRSRVPRALRERVLARSEGVCQCVGVCGHHEARCTTVITLDGFHLSHLRSHAHGGPLHETNLEAWCSACNLALSSRDAADPRLPPREWQLRELNAIVDAISRTSAATLSAAPGSGKTIFAGLVFEALRDAGLVERMLVVVPRRGLAEQWVEALTASRHIQLKPHAALERPGQDGVVVTYQSLPNRDQLEAHLIKSRQVPTLLALDEVHHLSRDAGGIHRAWGNAIAELAGDVETGNLNVAAVLNLSGTLWRSNKSERISTVRYSPPDDDGRITSLVDAEVSVQELVYRGELRSVDLYRLDAEVRIADYAELEYVEGNLSDLDERPAKAAQAALGAIEEWREAFVASVLDRLEQAHRALGGYHVKTLIVAARQDHASLFRDEVDRQMRTRGLQPLAALAVSRDEDEAQRALESFRAQKRVGVLCTVDMAGEGYDCPEIAVLGYASNKLTSLYVRQVTARAMRVTERERELATVLPAMVVLPDSPALVRELVAYMAPFTHEVLLEDERPDADETGDGPFIVGPRMQRFVLTEAQAGSERITVSFLDGTVENLDDELIVALQPHLEQANIPEVYRPRATGAYQRTIRELLRDRPFDFGGHEPGQRAKPQRTVTLEGQARMLQEQLQKKGGWWAINGNTPVDHFNHLINDHAGIVNGQRGNASIEQLERALAFATETIDAYRRTQSR
jgi:superfamily II DNA or RNA helicase